MIGRAARAAVGLTGVSERITPVGCVASTTVPHCWHSPQRPAHFAVVHPHSVQRKGAGAGRRVAMISGYAPHPTSPVRAGSVGRGDGDEVAGLGPTGRREEDALDVARIRRVEEQGAA
ncbi:hypothetical protein GCM10027058_11950 [Microbacterium neimengense]